ncbi:GCN5-related N-acetyltransferase 5, chloroplastic [Beta vulgaris subsp. vulgaris]|uniref:GCN5-related N-acetyltransferase 5, chloroplastic n=1 Tax=Beta vulgaris subsp. vulgaris TaxID=3555 RepID=UPI002036AA66|nr:GCN5-related N-acetyltransferase 5, chloroplastic [Beta vulgaris subsp. vulgaris]
MAATLFLLPSLDSHNHHFTFQHKPSSKLKLQSFSLSSQKRFNFSNFNSPFTSFSTSHSSDHPSSPIDYNTQNPPRIGCFLTNQELQKLEFLENFTYSCKLPSGYLSIRVMKDFELDITVDLLAVSFAESMFLPNMSKMYLTLLGYLIKQYLIERRGLMPHCATLIGFFREEKGDVDCDFNGEGREEELAGTVEVSFDKKGANASPPTPTPPKNSPYICNMSVKESLRRRGIGWHLLKASEELVSKLSSSRDVYLHCRMIDSAPLSMYKKAGYAIVKTDSFLVLLTLQRRKHLMCKELPALSKPLETVIVRDEEETSSSIDGRDSESLVFDEVLQSSLDMDE